MASLFGGSTYSAYEQNALAQREDQLRMLQLEAQTKAARQAAGITGFGLRQSQPSIGRLAATASTGGIGGGITGDTVAPMPTVGGVPTGQIPGTGAGSVGTTGGVQSVSEQERYDPWSKYRGQAGEQLAGQMGQLSPSDIYQQKLAQMATGEFSPTDPSYQFRFQEGQRAAERSLAARGLLNSGNAAIELQERGQQAASQEYGNQFSRLLQGLTGVESAYNSQMGRLMEMAGVNINPVAGGQLNVQQEQLGIDRGRLGLSAQELANQWQLGQQELGLKSQALSLQAQQQSPTNPTNFDWGSLFGSGGGGGGGTTSASWDEYFAARDAARAAQQQAQLG